MSLLFWGAWIEVVNSNTEDLTTLRRSSFGERGLKYFYTSRYKLLNLVAPLLGSVD